LAVSSEAPAVDWPTCQRSGPREEPGRSRRADRGGPLREQARSVLRPGLCVVSSTWLPHWPAGASLVSPGVL